MLLCSLGFEGLQSIQRGPAVNRKEVKNSEYRSVWYTVPPKPDMTIVSLLKKKNFFYVNHFLSHY